MNNTPFVMDFSIYIFIHTFRYNPSSGKVYVRQNKQQCMCFNYIYYREWLTFLTLSRAQQPVPRFHLCVQTTKLNK